MGIKILVGQPVFETLVQREKYLNAFRSYAATIKHGTTLAVHQYIGAKYQGLNVDVPSQFKVGPEPEPRLTQLAAHYLAQAMVNRDFLKQKLGRGQGTYAATVLLYFLATDSFNASRATDTSPYDPKTWGAGKRTLEEQYAYYASVDFWLCADTSTFITDEYLSDYTNYFEPGDIFDWHFVTEEGAKKLKREWPQIWADFGLDAFG